MAQKPDDASNLQGSNDVYVRALTTQTGGQTQSNPVADARAKLQAQQTGNGMGLVRRLFGFAGGTREVPGWTGSSDRAFDAAKQDFAAGNYARAAGDAVRGVVMAPVSRLATAGNAVGGVVNDIVLPKITDFAGGLVGYTAGNAPVAATPVAQTAPAPQPTPVAAVAGQTVAPQPVVANPQPSMSPRTHTVDDFVRATEGMSWRQMAHLLPFAPPDPRNPQLQAQSLLNALTRTAVGINLQGQRPSSGLEQAIARAQNASGGGIGSLNPLIGAQLRRGMAAE